MDRRAALTCTLLAMVFVVGLSGCAADRDWRQIGPPESYPCRTSEQNVTVAVRCWSSSAERRCLFRGDPGDEIVPVQLVIFNQGDRCITFSRTRAELRLAEGSVLRALPPGRLADRLQHGDAAAVIVNMFLGGRLATAISAATEHENRRRRQATRECSMELATIDPGEAMTGFVFFQLPDDDLREDMEENPATVHITHMPCGEAGLRFATRMPLEEPAPTGGGGTPRD